MPASDEQVDSNGVAIRVSADDMIGPNKVGVDDAVLKPESLRAMSDEELRTLESKMVRKMDLVIM